MICENIFANFKRLIIIHLCMCLPIYDFLLFCFVYSFQQFHIRVHINKSFPFFRGSVLHEPINFSTFFSFMLIDIIDDNGYNLLMFTSACIYIMQYSFITFCVHHAHIDLNEKFVNELA